MNKKYIHHVRLSCQNEVDIFWLHSTIGSAEHDQFIELDFTVTNLAAQHGGDEYVKKEREEETIKVGETQRSLKPFLSMHI